jgi:hypothetical protein
LTVQVYIRELGRALIEASESSDPRVLDLTLELLKRPALRLKRRGKLSAAASPTLISARTETMWQGLTQ